MTADQARDIANSAANKPLNDKVAEILRNIEKAAKKGESELDIFYYSNRDPYTREAAVKLHNSPYFYKLNSQNIYGDQCKITLGWGTGTI
jgi:hypothetical protein